MPAGHLFMKLVSPGKSVIEGEAEVTGFERQIVLSDWNWALSRKGKDSGTASTGSPGGNAGLAEPSVFSFSKSLDRSTTAMLSCLRNGQVLPSAEITLEEHSQSDFELVVTLKNIRILEYGAQAQMEDTRGSIEEDWVFNYHTIEINYKPTLQTQAKQPGKVSVELTRAPGASKDKPVMSSEAEERIRGLLEKVPADQRRPLWDRVQKDLDTLRDGRTSIADSLGGKGGAGAKPLAKK